MYNPFIAFDKRLPRSASIPFALLPRARPQKPGSFFTLRLA